MAAVLVAAGRVAATARTGRLSLVLTADEENSSTLGAHHIAPLLDLEPDGVVIAEPGGIETDFDRLHLVSRGLARTLLTVRADQGHSSLSGEAGLRNAGLELAAALLAQRDADVATPADEDGLVGWQTTTNPALRLEGGLGYGVLPGLVRAWTEVRTLPGADREQVLDALTAAARQGAGADADLAVEYDAAPHDWLPATRVPRSSPLATAAADALERVLGTRPPASVFPGTTDATWFAAARGWSVLPALGPGLLRRAHRADEEVSVQAVRAAADLYTELATAFCSGPAPSAGPVGPT
ncbi:M20/M25/M40 family metallo-hydrolase [Desertihabitans brevis]|uniref:M20/M25/M40 family metallo-hydrolase n=1 Tax=Desertihabitans brevis TaxID=2268447 RepID=A0A367YPW1_9ACTN|nr:M20/M25/M40 family metallo-hydrolase [Desertihabitans brevis]